MGNGDHELDQSYNLLLFKHFLLVVMRQIEAVKESTMTVTVNSLGFAGTHAVKREEDLELIRECSPIGILDKVSVPTDN